MKHIILILLLFTPSAHAEEFGLRDGDTVVFMGDSITAAQTYGKIIENYTLLRYPERKIRFINAGKGGDTAQTGLLRLERDVFERGATVVTVAFGVNDIGWGMRADDKHRKLYLDAIRKIVTRCRDKGVRVYICSAAITGADPYKSETDFLQKMCDEGMEISRSLGGEAIDVQREMRKISRRVWDANAQTTDPKSRASLHEADTIHLNETGQIAMAYAMLKGLGAPAEVTSATLDASSGQTSGEGCTVRSVKRGDGFIEFVREDSAWPLNLGLIGILSNRWVPLQDDLGRYMLTVLSLPAGQYTVTADGRKLAEYSSERLAAGVNLGSASPDPWEPGGPWDVQASLLRELTDARSRIAWSRRLLQYHTPDSAALPAYARETDEVIVAIEALQRRTARPTPVKFVVRRNEI